MVKYTEEQKEAAIALANEIGIMKASRELQICDQSIRAWRLRAEEKAHPVETDRDEPNGAETNFVDPLADDEPPVENIETIYPDQKEDLDSTHCENNQPSSSPDSVQEKQCPFVAGPDEKSQEIDRLRAENEELRVRNNLLKKSLYGIVEAIASL